MKHRKKDDAPSELKSAFKRMNWKLVGQLAACFAVIFIVYQVFVYYRIPFIIHAYAIILLALLIAYVTLARGFSCKPFDESLFPGDWDAERRAAYLAGDEKRKKTAKKLLLFIIPIILTFMIDMILINFSK